MGTQEPARTRRALAERERKLAMLAGRQHGVISRSQLLAAGLGPRTIRRRVEAGRLFPLHREVYALGHARVNKRGEWLGAVLACGSGALLSHRSAAALWGIAQSRQSDVDISGIRGRRRPRIALHEGGIHEEDRAVIDRIPVTTVSRTLLDLAEVVDERILRRALAEADRLGHLNMPSLERVCARAYGRRGLKPLRRLLDGDDWSITLSPLEDRVLDLCRKYDLPSPETNVIVLGREVDAFWRDQKLMVEADSFEFHAHRSAFEEDRARDAAMQVAGFRVVRLTHRRLKNEPAKVAAELRHLLGRRAGS